MWIVIYTNTEISVEEYMEMNSAMREGYPEIRESLESINDYLRADTETWVADLSEL